MDILTPNDNFILSNFRGGMFGLREQEGRYQDLNYYDRLCTLCNQAEVEDEFHLLLVCPVYSSYRNYLIPRYYRDYPNKEKFSLLMQSDNVHTIKAIVKFLKLARDLKAEAMGTQE